MRTTSVPARVAQSSCKDLKQFAAQMNAARASETVRTEGRVSIYERLARWWRSPSFNLAALGTVAGLAVGAVVGLQILPHSHPGGGSTQVAGGQQDLQLHGNGGGGELMSGTTQDGGKVQLPVGACAMGITRSPLLWAPYRAWMTCRKISVRPSPGCSAARLYCRRMHSGWLKRANLSPQTPWLQSYIAGEHRA